MTHRDRETAAVSVWLLVRGDIYRSTITDITETVNESMVIDAGVYDGARYKSDSYKQCYIVHT